MAKLEELVKAIADPELKAQLEEEISKLNERTRFGLVYERHIPETVVVGDIDPLNVGDHVRPKKAAQVNEDFRVIDISNGKARLLSLNTGKEQDIALAELLAVKRFGDPAYLGLEPLGSVRRSETRPSHVVINGENFYSLQALVLAYEGRVDCIYIDPPYNTGARDWTYNNRFVDENDSYRHSKWLSMMEKRLRLAKRLLKPDGVLIVTIDEKEYLRLGMLLEDVFEGERIQMVSSLINPAQQSRPGAFGRSDEYIFFVMLGSAAPKRMLLPRDWVSDKGRTFTGTARWDLLRRSGTSAARSDSPGGFYPIYVDPDGPKFQHIGEALEKGISDPPQIDDAVAVLPIRKDGSEGRWQVSPATLRQYLGQGRVRIGGSLESGYVIYYLKGGEYDKVLNGEYPVSGRNPDGSLRIGEVDDEEAKVVAVPATQWRIPSHDATQYGSRLLKKFLPNGAFPFPKSLYAVQDVLRFFVGDKQDALVLDFFAGSGTTLHATMLLNAEDDGCRRVVLITNNEVGGKTAKRLNHEGHFQGETEYERHGIFESITRPRIEAAISGTCADGSPVQGTYLNGTPMAAGFEENVEFFRLDYLDSDRVELGQMFDSVHPLLWLAAGARGSIPKVEKDAPYLVAASSDYSVLFQDRAFRDFEEALAERKSITHVFLITDSDEAYAEMREHLGPDKVTMQLYRDFLRHFRRRASL